MEDMTTYLANIDENELKTFVKDLKPQIKATTDVHRVISDISWVEMVEDSIPYLDNIIRNPRRFIVQEENIVPIEKAKVVTEESIRHLAQNTNLIQDVEEDGTVIPLKLLNVYREETVDLYENRFIKSLVDNLYQFVNNKLAESDQQSRVDTKNKVSYEATQEIGNNKIKINLNLESANAEVIEAKDKDGHSLETRIEHIKDVLAAFRGSQFIKNLQASQPVRSPIRKTNVILKEPNFIKALELWEYLESNAIKPMTSVEDESLDRAKDIIDKYNLAFYLTNDSLKLNKDTKYDKMKSRSRIDLTQVISDVLSEDDLEEKVLKRMLNQAVKKAYAQKREEEAGVKKAFVNFLKEYNRNRQKALDCLK